MIDRSQRQIAVIGAGFGDEGKGKVVSNLCSVLRNPLVIRYCGGQQAAHHVVVDEKLDHVFSNFGSGTLQGVDTYWSQYCTVDPVGILSEREVLLSKKPLTAKLYISSRCPVTTPHEKTYNKNMNDANMHGSCGVGIGATHQREEAHYSLTAGDLLYPSVLKTKLEMIQQYYKSLYRNGPVRGTTYWAEIEPFLLDCEQLADTNEVKIVNKWMINLHSNFIFEGSQGLLLDPGIGFFPHVTRSNTGTKNIREMMFQPEIYLVTRAYQTRHGNGPMTNEKISHKIKTNPHEKNTDTGAQGVFRRSLLDLDLLKYAISKDSYIMSASFNLVVTCLDLMESFAMTDKGLLCEYDTEDAFVGAIWDSLMSGGFHIKEILLSRTPFPEIEEWR